MTKPFNFSKGCDNSRIEEASQCPAKGEKGNNYEPIPPDVVESDLNKYNTKDSSNEKVVVPQTGASRINDRKMNLPEADKLNHEGAEIHSNVENGLSTFLSFFIPIALIITIVLWVFYAYRNPHTKSGQLLIQVKLILNCWFRFAYN